MPCKTCFIPLGPILQNFDFHAHILEVRKDLQSESVTVLDTIAISAFNDAMYIQLEVLAALNICHDVIIARLLHTDWLPPLKIA